VPLRREGHRPVHQRGHHRSRADRDPALPRLRGTGRPEAVVRGVRRRRRMGIGEGPHPRPEPDHHLPPERIVITSLEVPYVDVSAGSLTFRPDAPSMPVLDQLERDAGPLRLSLRLLGASHQAVVATPDGLIAETLAYRDGL